MPRKGMKVTDSLQSTLWDGRTLLPGGQQAPSAENYDQNFLPRLPPNQRGPGQPPVMVTAPQPRRHPQQLKQAQEAQCASRRT